MEDFKTHHTVAEPAPIFLRRAIVEDEDEIDVGDASLEAAGRHTAKQNHADNLISTLCTHPRDRREINLNARNKLRLRYLRGHTRVGIM